MTPAVASLTAWVLASMISAQPSAPWRESYETTAAVLAQVATDAPLFGGREGARRTASWFVSVAWFESRFDPRAQGDCRRKDPQGRCLSDPQSLCLFQIGVSNLPSLKKSPSDLLESVETCTRVARQLMQISLGVCRGRALEEGLGHYASGGASCGGLRESRHRVNKARWLFDHIPAEKSE